jgi:hypothetical protein
MELGGEGRNGTWLRVSLRGHGVLKGQLSQLPLPVS